MEKESFCEILFRGKRKDNGEWIEGFYAECKNTAFISSMPCVKTMRGSNCDGRGITDYCGLGFFYEVVPETVGRYTGLTDKNGRKIFEGDIVEFQFDNNNCPFPNKDTKKRIGRVYFEGFRASFAIAMGRNGSSVINNNLFRYVQFGNRVSVIGNIHDNPELLTGEE